jgi:hypothetical protein
MVQVVEYGENIGTLRNLFLDEKEAMKFARTIMDYSAEEYTYIGSRQWYCARKNEYVKVEIL